MLLQIIFLMPLRNKLVTMELTLWFALDHQSAMTIKEKPMKTSWNVILVNSKRSYSKHNLLSTATTTKQLQHYLTKTLFTADSVSSFSFFHFFLSSFYLSLFYYHYHSFIVFRHPSLLVKILITGIISSALLLDGL